MAVLTFRERPAGEESLRWHGGARHGKHEGEDPVAFEVLKLFGGAVGTAKSFRVQCPTATVTQPDKTATQDVNSSEPPYQTPASLGIKMHVVGFKAELLRHQAHNHTEYLNSSIALSHGESLDVFLDASDTGFESPGCVRLRIRRAASSIFYTTNLDPMSNDVENLGGLLTEVRICATVPGAAHTVIPAIWERGNEPWTTWHKQEIN